MYQRFVSLSTKRLILAKIATFVCVFESLNELSKSLNKLSKSLNRSLNRKVLEISFLTTTYTSGLSQKLIKLYRSKDHFWFGASLYVSMPYQTRF